jgi:signal transduction histidine kinase
MRNTGREAATLLVVDDNATNLGVLYDHLDAQGFRVLTARDGERALARARRARPDLILLDVMMPGIDGFETCRRLKAEASTQDIPVIFMTALANVEDKVQGFAAGAVDYVTKPLQQEEVLARITTHLRIRELTHRLQARNARLEQLTAELQDANAEILRFNEELEALVQQRTEALQKAYAQLELLDRNKSEFIAVVSHELRTPLTVFTGYAWILRRNAVIQEHAELKQMADAIHASSEQLKGILNAMVDIARIDNRTLELRFQPLSLADTLGQVTKGFDDALRERDLALDLDGLASLPPVQADGQELQKVFENLVSNAIKYTPDGGTISIMGEVLADHDPPRPQDCVQVTVADTGIGIDPQYHEAIFTKFYHTGNVDLHSSGRTKFKGGGPGLGLAIAKGIVEAHGGQIWVESAGYDEAACPGSQFHVILPLAPAQERTAD